MAFAHASDVRAANDVAALHVVGDERDTPCVGGYGSPCAGDVLSDASDERDTPCACGRDIHASDAHDSHAVCGRDSRVGDDVLLPFISVHSLSRYYKNRLRVAPSPPLQALQVVEPCPNVLY